MSRDFKRFVLVNYSSNIYSVRSNAVKNTIEDCQAKIFLWLLPFWNFGDCRKWYLCVDKMLKYPNVPQNKFRTRVQYSAQKYLDIDGLVQERRVELDDLQDVWSLNKSNPTRHVFLALTHRYLDTVVDCSHWSFLFFTNPLIYMNTFMNVIMNPTSSSSWPCASDLNAAPRNVDALCDGAKIHVHKTGRQNSWVSCAPP